MTSQKTIKQGRVGTQNKQIILAAAEVEFAKNGYKGTRIQQVADRAKLPKTNVLYYFKSKEGLYLAVLEQILGLWNSAFDHATAEDDPAEVLAHYIAEKMEFSLSKPEASKVFALEIINGAPNLTGFFKQQHIKWMEGRIDVIQAWIDNDKLETTNAYYFLFHIWACCQHYADFAAQISNLRGGPMNKTDFAEATRCLIKTILTGSGLIVPKQYQ